ncbi:hypothetical protein ACFQ0H_07975 [Lysobacter gummosus]|uniref:hypothetical protein n=1 Tax=Lysobacter gummosus TaxID=262324 RepID=UPI003644AC13
MACRWPSTSKSPVFTAGAWVMSTMPTATCVGSRIRPGWCWITCPMHWARRPRWLPPRAAPPPAPTLPGSVTTRTARSNSSPMAMASFTR